jgi:hypothetical protein
MDENFGAVAPTEETATPVVETPKAPETPTADAPKEQPVDRFAPKFAALTRKEREIKERERKLAEAEKTRLADIEKKAKELEEREKSSVSYKDRMKQNVIKFLEEEGYTYEQISEMVLNEGNPTQEMQMKRLQEEIEGKTLTKIQELEKKLAEKEQKEKEEREALLKQRQEEAVTEFKNQIKNDVEANAETYELIKFNEAYDLVYEVIEQIYEQMSDEDKTAIGQNPKKIDEIRKLALDEVEGELVARATRIKELKKLKQTSKSEEPEQKKTAPTLSNTLATEVPLNGRRPMSDDEAVLEAAKLIKWS